MQHFLKIYTDGGARGNPGFAACAFVVVRDGRVIYKDSLFLNTTTNNVAEYTGVIYALEWLTKNWKNFPEEKIFFFLDSELVVKQLTGKYKIKSKHLKILATRVKKIESQIGKKIVYKLVGREKNTLADSLVNKKIDENILQFHVEVKATKPIT